MPTIQLSYTGTTIDGALGKALTATQPADLDGLNEAVAVLQSTETAQGNGTYLISGATVAWVSDYTYRVGAAVYSLAGTQVLSAEQSVTLATADETFPRIDVLALDANGVLSAIAGTPGDSPVQPTVEPDEYYAVSLVIVAPSTAEAAVVTTAIYTEGAEWTTTASAGTLVVGSTNTPRTGTKCIEGTAVAGGTYVTAVSAAAIDPSQQNSLIFYIRNKAAWDRKKSIRLTWFNGTTRRGNALVVGTGAYGFDSAATAAYQQVVVPLSAFVIPAGLTVDRLRWEVTGGGSTVGFYLDDMLLQAGVSSQQAPVMLFTGEWAATRVYALNQIVTKSGSTYIALAPSLNEDPTTSASWAVLSSARKFYPNFFFEALPVAGQTMLHVVLPTSVTFPQNLTGSVGYAKVAATQQSDYSIKLNGNAVGTIRFAAEGSTPTFIAAAAFSGVAGDRLEVLAPDPVDPTLANFSATLVGAIS